MRRPPDKRLHFPDGCAQYLNDLQTPTDEDGSMTCRMRLSKLRCLLLGIILWVPSVLSAAEQPAVSIEIRSLLQDHAYAAAIREIDAALAASAGSATAAGSADELLYLKGRAQHYAKDYADAIETFDRLLADSPNSPLRRQASFAKAASLARQGDFQAAELIYRAEAEYLLSTDRKHELASIYLDFAASYFEPPQTAGSPDAKQPDYEQARKFFEKALEIGPESRLAAEIHWKVGQCMQQQEDYPAAAQQYQEILDKYEARRAQGRIKGSDFADSLAADLQLAPLMVDVRYRLGWCQLQMGEFSQARRTWQDLLADEPLRQALPEGDAAAERLAEARFHIVRTYSIPQPDSLEQLDLGIAALERFIEQHAPHKLASQAHLLIAQSLMHRQQYQNAATRLQQFLQQVQYADREEVAESRYRLAQCLLLQQDFANAIEAVRDYLAKHPSHRYWADAQQLVIQAEYLAAAMQQDRKQFEAARELWQQFLAKYPLDERAPEILFGFGAMEYEQEHWQAAIDQWRSVVQKYPETEVASKAQYQLALTLETKLGQLEAAHEQYERLNWGDYARAAQQRICAVDVQTLVRPDGTRVSL